MPIPNQLGNNDGKDMPEKGVPAPMSGLISYISPKLKRAEDVRDTQFALRWDEYTRLWRGFWTEADKNTNSERSRLIAPALQQAIEMTAAEIEEATFGRIAWFDIEDDLQDQQKDDATATRDQLLEDFELAKVPAACSAAFLLGAIYGTGIAKINVGRKLVRTAQNGQTVTENRVMVTADAVRPDEFLIDPSATNVDEAHFVAHEMLKPMHLITRKQRDGIYRKVPVGTFTGEKEGDSTGTGLTTTVDPQDDGVMITEYFGLVPAKFIPDSEEQGETLVESIVTIANRNVVLRAVESPFTNKDRPIVAYQHDTVPGEFWGRGVSEKGYNPQKALDAELRARMDGLALVTAPMLGADVTRLPRNPDLRVRPGKVLLTRGRPSEVVEPVGFNAQGLALSFQQSGDLERMVQMGTGAMDSAIPVSSNRRNETASGMSQIQGSFLKRAKRTMQNIERQFLDPLIRRATWRYMQFDPERYPQDTTFVVHSTMGLMAKEVEQNQLVQVLGFTPPESPAHTIILKTLLENTTSSEKGDIKQAIEAMLAPPSPEQQELEQMQQQLAIEAAKEELLKLKLENAKTQAEIEKTNAQTQQIVVETDLEDDRVQIEAANAAVNAENARNRTRDIEVKREIATSKPKGG